MSEKLALVYADHPTPVLVPERHVFALLLLRESISDHTASLTARNLDYQDKCIRDGHNILSKYLEAEDLVEILNTNIAHHSVSLTRLDLPTEYY